eukprot:1415715-Pyramimonas_sp.AAC.1
MSLPGQSLISEGTPRPSLRKSAHIGGILPNDCSIVGRGIIHCPRWRVESIIRERMCRLQRLRRPSITNILQCRFASCPIITAICLRCARQGSRVRSLERASC